MLSFSSKLAATLGAAALTMGITAPIATAAPAPAPQAAKPTISWEDCPEQVDIDNAECGRIEVPTYYDNPEAGTISVGFVRVPAANPGVVYQPWWPKWRCLWMGRQYRRSMATGRTR